MAQQLHEGNASSSGTTPQTVGKKIKNNNQGCPNQASNTKFQPKRISSPLNDTLHTSQTNHNSKEMSMDIFVLENSTKIYNQHILSNFIRNQSQI